MPKRPAKNLLIKAANRLVMTRPVQIALAPFGRDLNPDRWIFVVGCYNSGTTLLATILRHHPDLAGLWTEGAYLTDTLPYPEQRGWPRMWCKCVDHVRLEPGEEGERKASRAKRHWSLWFPREAANLVEKTVSSGARMPFLDAYFRPAYFVYIRRNGYAVAAGIRKKANLNRWGNPFASQGGYPIGLCAEQWRVADEFADRDGPGLERFLPISYEDLTDHPTTTMAKITDFLGIDAFPDGTSKRGWTIHEDRSGIRNMNPESLAGLSEEDLDRIDEVAGDQLRKYGYTRPL
jgi:hypothetical protein